MPGRGRPPAALAGSPAPAAAVLAAALLFLELRTARALAVGRLPTEALPALPALPDQTAALDEAVRLLQVQEAPAAAPLWPNPYVVWVQNGLFPTTLPPLPEQCHGCGCLFVFPDRFIINGGLAPKFTAACASPVGAAAGVALVPELRWAGPAGAGGGPRCERCSSFAVTVADLDAPGGAGTGANHVEGLFWAVNVPSDWTELSQEKLAGGSDGVVVGRNTFGALGMSPVCPRAGRHRLRVTVWALRSALPGLGPDTPYSEVVSQLECAELARATTFAEVTALPR